MSYKESDIMHETKNFFVIQQKSRSNTTMYCVYKTGITHATRCATIHYSKDLPKALARAIAECNKRQLTIEV